MWFFTRGLRGAENVNAGRRMGSTHTATKHCTRVMDEQQKKTSPECMEWESWIGWKLKQKQLNCFWIYSCERLRTLISSSFVYWILFFSFLSFLRLINKIRKRTANNINDRKRTFSPQLIPFTKTIIDTFLDPFFFFFGCCFCFRCIYFISISFLIYGVILKRRWVFDEWKESSFRPFSSPSHMSSSLFNFIIKLVVGSGVLFSRIRLRCFALCIYTLLLRHYRNRAT